MTERLADDAADRHARIERARTDPGRSSASRGAGARSSSRPSVRDVGARRRAPRRRSARPGAGCSARSWLAAARLADQPERLAVVDRRSETPSTALTAPTSRRRMPCGSGSAWRGRATREQRRARRAAVGLVDRLRRLRSSSARGVGVAAASGRRHVEAAAQPWPGSTSSSVGVVAHASARRSRSAAEPAAGRIEQVGRRARDRRRAGPSVRGRRGAGSSAAGPRCRGGAGCAKSPRRRASSTTCPAYMTTTRSAVSATTPRSWVISMTAMPSSSCSSRISSRICAWIVTSSAVVGSSAIEQLRACRRAPSRSSRAGACRPRTGADTGRARAAGVRDADQLEQLDRALVPPRARCPLMESRSPRRSGRRR